MRSRFGWDYPPGVTGNEPHLIGVAIDDCVTCGWYGELCPVCGNCDECPCECAEEEEESDV